MELVLPQADKMIHALKKLHIVERCFRTGAGRGGQRLRRCTNQRGYSLSRKRISPLEPQEKGFWLAVSGL